MNFRTPLPANLQPLIGRRTPEITGLANMKVREREREVSAEELWEDDIFIFFVVI